MAALKFPVLPFASHYGRECCTATSWTLCAETPRGNTSFEGKKTNERRPRGFKTQIDALEAQSDTAGTTALLKYQIVLLNVENSYIYGKKKPTNNV